MTDMTCRRFSDLLEEYLDGSLSVELSEAVDEHARSCRDCGAMLSMKRKCLQKSQKHVPVSVEFK